MAAGTLPASQYAARFTTCHAVPFQRSRLMTRVCAPPAVAMVGALKVQMPAVVRAREDHALVGVERRLRARLDRVERALRVARGLRRRTRLRDARAVRAPAG